MKRAVLTVIFAGLASSALAQGLPALEGNGSQTQSLELVNGAVSASIETSGALSLGRGADNLDGAATLTVNGLSVGVGSEQAEETTSPSSKTGTPRAQRAEALPSGAVNGPATVSNSVTSADPLCAMPLPDIEALALALDEGYRLVRVETECPAASADLDALLGRSPDFVAAFEAAGAKRSGLVSITINNGVVILGYDDKR